VNDVAVKFIEETKVKLSQTLALSQRKKKQQTFAIQTKKNVRHPEYRFRLFVCMFWFVLLEHV